MKKICVTGANGFIGQSLCKALSNSGYFVRGFVRTLNTFPKLRNLEYVKVGNIDLNTNWENSLFSFDCLIHCAGIANTTKKDDKDIYNSVNFEGTKNLAEQAVKAGVRRFIFLSTIKVNGESTSEIFNKKENLKESKFIYSDIPNPQDIYSISKYRAEKALWEISYKNGLEIVILRLPLVYGKFVKGNIERLIKLIKTGVPLPLGLINNQRSFIGIDNLIDLLIKCIHHSDAANKTFLVSDGEDLSTPELLNKIAFEVNQPLTLFPFPVLLLKFFSRIFGKKNEMNRLLNSLQVDNSYVCETLNWTPIVSVSEGFKRMIKN